jgi:hypothetical protein
MSDGYKGIVYADKDGRPDPTRRFIRWEDWVEWHDKHAHADMLRVIGQGIAVIFDKRIEPYKARIAELEAKMEEQRKSFRYCGVWEARTEFRAGNFVTHNGSLWHCNATTRNVPGRDPVSWTLCCKRGADGKDARQPVPA